MIATLKADFVIVTDLKFFLFNNVINYLGWKKISISITKIHQIFYWIGYIYFHFRLLKKRFRFKNKTWWSDKEQCETLSWNPFTDMFSYLSATKIVILSNIHLNEIAFNYFIHGNVLRYSIVRQIFCKNKILIFDKMVSNIIMFEIKNYFHEVCHNMQLLIFSKLMRGKRSHLRGQIILPKYNHNLRDGRGYWISKTQPKWSCNYN